MSVPLMRAAALAVGLLAPLVLTAPAGAQDPTAAATGTVQVGIGSVTVSPTTFGFSECFDQEGARGTLLTFPNGVCQGPDLTITNGEAPAHIHVRGSDFDGSVGGPSWDLSTGERPGAEQASLTLHSPCTPNCGTFVVLGNDNQCEPAWDREASNPAARCAAAAGQSVVEGPSMMGPSTTTNGSPSFSTTITWTALP